MTTTVTGVDVVTVAVVAWSVKRAISPKKSPGPSVLTFQAATPHLGLAFEQDEELRPGGVLPDHSFPAGKIDLVGNPAHCGEILLAHVLEERDALKSDELRILLTSHAAILTLWAGAFQSALRSECPRAQPSRSSAGEGLRHANRRSVHRDDHLGVPPAELERGVVERAEEVSRRVDRPLVRSDATTGAPSRSTRTSSSLSAIAAWR